MEEAALYVARLSRYSWITSTTMVAIIAANSVARVTEHIGG
jgi:hypothetical protein